jgi:hypothetical protein
VGALLPPVRAPSPGSAAGPAAAAAGAGQRRHRPSAPAPAQVHPEEGGPLLEWGHVVECLNKLDAGVPEKLLLLSRDEKSLLVASYADIKRCVDQAYNELKGMGAAARGAGRYKA